MNHEITPNEMKLSCFSSIADIGSIIGGFYCGYQSAKGVPVDAQSAIAVVPWVVNSVLGYHYGMEIRKSRKTIDEIARAMPTDDLHMAKEIVYKTSPSSGVAALTTISVGLYFASYGIGKFVGNHS